MVEKRDRIRVIESNGDELDCHRCIYSRFLNLVLQRRRKVRFSIRYSAIRRDCLSRSRPAPAPNFLLVNRSASATILVRAYTNTRGQTANTCRASTVCITTVVVTLPVTTTSTGRGCTRARKRYVCVRIAYV